MYPQKFSMKDVVTLFVGTWCGEKQQNKLVEWKAFVDTVRINSAYNFSLQSFEAFRASLM